MKLRAVAVMLLLTAGLTACDNISDKVPFIGRKKAAPVVVKPSAAPKPAPAPVDSTPKVAEARKPKPLAAGPSATDEPWTPIDTGTVNPGMTRDEVIARWGEPVAERTRESWGYLYFRNGCEVTCGTFDVVFLENGQVVDAVVRGPGHTYAGNSSSPAGRIPEATTPQLNVPAAPPAPSQAPSPAPGGAA